MQSKGLSSVFSNTTVEKHQLNALIHPKNIIIILILQKKALRFIELGNLFKATELDVMKLDSHPGCFKSL